MSGTRRNKWNERGRRCARLSVYEPATLERCYDSRFSCEAQRWTCGRPALYRGRTGRYRSAPSVLCERHAIEFARRHEIALPYDPARTAEALERVAR